MRTWPGPGKNRRGRTSGATSAVAPADLKAAFADQLQARKEARAQAQREARTRAEEAQLFAREFEGVTPLKDSNRVIIGRTPAPPVPRQRNIDEQQALASTLSDEVDLTLYLESDEALAYRAAGVGADVVTRLRRGAFSISAQLDLHGLRRDEARDTLASFLDDCRTTTKRCVRVIHGKGLGSANREPVLKDKVRKWLVQRKDVLAFCQAPPNDGGGGALLVLLAGRRK